MPGDRQEISLEFTSPLPEDRIKIVIDSWTTGRITLNR
jgi:hypothetical protein